MAANFHRHWRSMSLEMAFEGLARIDPELLGPVQHRSQKAQADLTVIRAQAGLVRARKALINTRED